MEAITRRHSALAEKIAKLKKQRLILLSLIKELGMPIKSCWTKALEELETRRQYPSDVRYISDDPSNAEMIRSALCTYLSSLISDGLGDMVDVDGSGDDMVIAEGEGVDMLIADGEGVEDGHGNGDPSTTHEEGDAAGSSEIRTDSELVDLHIELLPF
ncbi:uncharacterized protein LOC118750907 [Rhagoletis pomonella]|uniref:uncharacterized protein LOC118750907 n=1 Tax=Rhagoletis pomonella TaxID=28610 RepID=UPI001784FF85|nr:uncharacterized protein LOC118750907 [Rhagoletis pomonella]